MKAQMPLAGSASQGFQVQAIVEAERGLGFDSLSVAHGNGWQGTLSFIGQNLDGGERRGEVPAWQENPVAARPEVGGGNMDQSPPGQCGGGGQQTKKKEG